MKKFLLLVAFTLLMSVPLQAQDDVVIVATNISDLQSLDPANNGSSTNLSVFYTVYERLYELPADPSQPLIPNLATGHSVSEDGFTWTFNLREGVTFASGNPFTAEDVVFSWKRVQNFQNEPAQVFNLFVGDVVAVDTLTVEVQLSNAIFPLPIPFFDVLTTLPSFSILDSKLVMENGGSLDPAQDTATEWLNQNSAGSGPFILAGWTPEAELRMVRNDNYWTGTPPAIAGVTLRQANDSTTALQLAERGEVDIAQNLDKDLAATVEASENLSLQIGQSLAIVYLALSPANAESPLADVRVRQAVMLSIDYDGIIDGLLGGLGVRPGGVVPLGILGGTASEVVRYQRDVAAAQALLAEAGFADGVTINLNMSTLPLGGVAPDVLAAKLTADLAEAGITLNVQIDPPSVYLTGRNAGEYDAFLANFSADFFDPTNWTVLYGVADFQNIAAYIRLADPAIAEAAFATLFAPPDVREMAVVGFNAAITEQALYSVLYQPQVVDAVASSLNGYVFHPIQKVRYQDLSR
jgi:peptide/nickel transport system substrate-binding protein